MIEQFQCDNTKIDVYYDHRGIYSFHPYDSNFFKRNRRTIIDINVNMGYTSSLTDLPKYCMKNNYLKFKRLLIEKLPNTAKKIDIF